LEPLPPSPAGLRPLKIECDALRPNVRPHHHEVRLSSDWQLVDVPEVLRREQLAARLGGTRCCLDEIERVVAAVNHAVQICSRRMLPVTAVERLRAVDSRHPALRSPLSSDRDEEAAAAHRSVEHLLSELAREFGVETRSVVLAYLQVFDAHMPGLRAMLMVRYGLREDICPDFQMPPDCWHAAEYVEDADLAAAWRTHLHPELLARVHESVVPGRGPMTLAFYRWVLGRSADHQSVPIGITLWRWLFEGVEHPHVAAWLAEHAIYVENRMIDRLGRAPFAALTLDDLRVLQGDRYTLHDVLTLAADAGLRMPHALRVLSSWSSIGCSLPVVDLAELHAFGVALLPPPSLHELERLCKRFPHAERNDIVVVLALCGYSHRASPFLIHEAINKPALVARHVGRRRVRHLTSDPSSQVTMTGEAS
jgi:hypothetical protein